MDVKEVIAILENAPRKGRPEFNQTIELDAHVADAMLAALKALRVRVKRSKEASAR